MRKHRKGIIFKPIFIGLILIGLGGYYMIRFGLYPVAIANSDFISAKKFVEAEQFIVHYYETAYETYGLPELNLDDPTYGFEIKRATLDKLIENELVYAELKKRTGRSLGKIVENKLNSVTADSAQFEQAVSTVYGLTLNKFREAVLVPQAHEEILRGRLFAEDVDFNEWILEVRGDARVTIFDPGLMWDGLQVQLR